MRLILCLALLSVTPFVPARTTQEGAAPKDTTPAAIPAASPAPEPAADPSEKVCKVAREIGSNKLKRVCRTRAQMDADREAAREALTREQRR